MKRGLLWSLVLGVPAGFVLWFFRDPARIVPTGDDLVVSPADGLVTRVERISRGEPGTCLSIRLSLLDVHVTRAPVSGRVTSITYRPGRFLSAYGERSSAENEQNRVHIAGSHGSVILTQIAGKIARRIEFHPRQGDWLERGQRVGRIRFGSRVDLELPGNVTILVTVGDRVRGGSSIVARGEF